MVLTNNYHFLIPIGKIVKKYCEDGANLCYILIMRNKENIILVGMPAAGKSTVGVILAKKIGYSFLDTDVYLQSREKKLLPDIIEKTGVEEFCRIEEQHVLSIMESSHVIATGGSVVYGKKAMEHLKNNGLVVYLETSVDILLTRIVNPQQRGVVKKPDQSIESLFEERHPLYIAVADTVINCDESLSPVQTADEILSALSV